MSDDSDSKKRVHAIACTCNNWTEEVLTAYKKFAETNCTYAVIGKEVGEKEGTPHLQYSMWFKNARTMQSLRKQLKGSHIAKCLGSAEQNRDYCFKQDADAWEFGTMPKQGERNDIHEVAKGVITGNKRMRTVMEEAPVVYLKYHKGLEKMRKEFMQAREWKTEITWIYGPTGTGKSHYACMQAGKDVFWKMGGNKWWDGYDGHECVIIDDWRRDMCTFHELLKILDKYPMDVETKGGTVRFAPLRIYITTPKCPRESWRNKEDGSEREDIGQLLRRIENVKYMDTPYTPKNDTEVIDTEVAG